MAGAEASIAAEDLSGSAVKKEILSSRLGETPPVQTDINEQEKSTTSSPQKGQKHSKKLAKGPKGEESYQSLGDKVCSLPALSLACDLHHKISQFRSS